MSAYFSYKLAFLLIQNGIKYYCWLTLILLLSTSFVNAQVIYPMHVESGWNLMSLYMDVFDGTKIYIFPNAVSDAFIYQSQYVAKDTLEHGYGFWLKFDADETLNIPGGAIYRDTIFVQSGWNIIGSLAQPILVGNLISEPGGIVISDYFYYRSDMGYQSSDTIKPGVGYWVKVNQDGRIILSSMGYPCPGITTVDYEGQSYNTVQISSQCWLKENINVGTMILGSDTGKDNSLIEKYCYNNDPAYCNTYGGLYQWDEAMQYVTTSGERGICPPGWHIPTYAEFATLTETVVGNSNALKAIGQGAGDGAGTNTCGFSALLSGRRSNDGNFSLLSYTAYFWSSNEYSSTATSIMNMEGNNKYVTLNYYGFNKKSGLSIRCIKD